MGRRIRVDEFECPSCSASWRDVNDIYLTGTKPVLEAKYRARSPLNSLAGADLFRRSENFQTRTTGRQFAVTKMMATSQLAVFTAAGVFLLAGLHYGFALFASGNPPADDQTSALRLSDVELVKKKNAVGSQVFSVQGRLRNPSGDVQATPRISITLYQSNGAEIANWIHRAPVNLVGANATVRFVSSIQHDNPFAAYAGAEFVQ